MRKSGPGLSLLLFLLISPSMCRTARCGLWSEGPEPEPRVAWHAGEGRLSSKSGLESDLDPPRFIASNLDPEKLSRFAARGPSPRQWSALLALYVLPGSGTIAADQPPILGRYRAGRGIVEFIPRYSMVPGLTLRARLDPGVLDTRDARPESARPGVSRPVTLDFKSDDLMPSSFDRAGPPSGSILSISPANAVLPENLLRIYIQFSQPMARGDAYPHIRLLDETGKPVPDPFLELDEELWTRDGRRFTLLFDPGRIKRGLKPREEVGPILEEGKSYTLEIDRAWPNANGNPLIAGLRKSFRVGPPDATTPDPANWKLEVPRGACLDALKVRFPEPLDRALSLRLISVIGPDGQPVKGSAELSHDQTDWQFKPEAFWQAGKEYRLLVGTDLEDLAGNGIGRPFEVDMTRPITSRVKTETVTLPFRIGPAAR